MAIDLESLYQYYIEQGATAPEATAYTLYYLPEAQKKSFRGVTTPKWKTSQQIEFEVAPNYSKFKQEAAAGDTFWQSVINAIDAGDTYADLQRIAYSDEGANYAERQGLVTNTGDLNLAAVMSNVGRAFNERTSANKAKKKQTDSLNLYARSIGAPSVDKVYRFKLDEDYGENEVEYAPVRKVYLKLLNQLDTNLTKAGIKDTDLKDEYLSQFRDAFQTAVNAKLESSNLTPFAEYVLRKGGK